MNNNSQWIFIDDKGTFQLDSPELSSYLYFPLTNEAGMMSSITPTLNGDAKTGQNTFALLPVSGEDLHNSRMARNFWVYIEGKGAWSVAGLSAVQQAGLFNEDKEETKLTAGILWHKLERSSKNLGLKAEITSFVPAGPHQVELTKITITNMSGSIMRVTPTAAVPIYARSADNLRDHRHVTSLLHRIYTTRDGVVVKPTLTFDERGHKLNEMTYGVLGRDDEGNSPIAFFPILEEFIGQGGNLENPEAIIRNKPSITKEGECFEAYEAMGGLRFATEMISPGKSKTYVVAIGIDAKGAYFEDIASEYLSEKKFDKHFQETIKYWNQKLNLTFETGDRQLDGWMKWVSLEPILRRIYGCSFLPHHDYGRGGRGWRDLWQDCLALLIMEPQKVKDMLISNFGGVRFDGTNATIIGSGQGEFIADRNNITRVWMDHGAWPFLTTKLYIEQSGDVMFLLEKTSYFKDPQIARGQKKDSCWNSSYGRSQLDEKLSVYKGSILEHLLVQHLTAFYDVGQHNTMCLHGADWNDGLDMAVEQGESAAFTALYAYNLKEIARLIQILKEQKAQTTILLAKELTLLLVSCNYEDIEEKRKVLAAYLKTCEHNISGATAEIQSDALIENLEQKAAWLTNHLRKNEWIQSKEGYRWFNGYYDNKGQKVEGDHEKGIRMMLTSQVFTIMGGIAENDQVEEIIRSANHYLYDKKIGGYRLNTPFRELKTDMGRLFGFGYGHKENGAVFSHMAVMYANALYMRGYVRDGYKVLSTLYKHCSSFEKSRIYPGIPEYINEKGRGMYPYLTGAASWFILTALTEMFGIKGSLGDLKIEPKLLKMQFDKEGIITIRTVFANKGITIKYSNHKDLEYGEYVIKEIFINGNKCFNGGTEEAALISRQVISECNETEIEIRVNLDSRLAV
ncbi:GH36-type glycosyl hydrolase domain-containing protein [Cellulosilyticum sp. I15G10I2]|uniref:GH36-type glycosyl hydrolase domain-containing protein n=1 Tax=Cellulosilyticum sp. I15G10I2 TaxID=1892843 RepID=UPI00085CA8D2|nr:cellobiose phosphorylase [Cellulosilyticum sp. I15G10I2]